MRDRILLLCVAGMVDVQTGAVLFVLILFGIAADFECGFCFVRLFLCLCRTDIDIAKGINFQCARTFNQASGNGDIIFPGQPQVSL